MKRVSWKYLHSLNRKSKLWRTKEGDYYGKVNHTRKHWEHLGAVPMAIVKFDGNKTTSTVPFSKLKFLEEVKNHN